jgi:hypothetical protein
MPSSTTQFTITGTDANGCSQTTVATVAVDACTAVQELQALKGLKVYPNPTGGMITIELNTSFAKDVQISDVTGRIVLSQQGTGSTFSMNLNSLSAGVYYVRVKSQDAVEVIRVVKQ